MNKTHQQQANKTFDLLSDLDLAAAGGSETFGAASALHSGTSMPSSDPQVVLQHHGRSG